MKSDYNKLMRKMSKLPDYREIIQITVSYCSEMRIILHIEVTAETIKMKGLECSASRNLNNWQKSFQIDEALL